MTCDELKSSIIEWVSHETECTSRHGEDSFVLTLPLLKPNGDAIELGFERSEGQRWRISDLGETYSTLFLDGVDLYEEYVRAEELRQIKELHRIAEREQELFIETLADDLAPAVFDFVHAIQSFLSLQLTVVAKPPKRDFDTAVTKFLADQRASFEIPAENIEGKTGRWKFNFVLNRNFLFGLPAIENIHASASQRVQCFLREDHQLRASLSGSPKTVQSASKPSFFRQLSIPGG